MSAKVCLPAWNGGPQNTRDAITLGQLEQMILSLCELGFDLDTPVTYLFDEDHVWLETVEWDAQAVFSKVVVPRVVEELGEDEKGAEWIDSDGDRWRWYLPGGGNWQIVTRRSDGAWADTALHPNEDFEPYVEVVQ